METKAQSDSLDAVNRDVVALWQNCFPTAQPPVRWPLIHPPLGSGGLLAVGCNPSFPKGDEEAISWFSGDDDVEQRIKALSDWQAKRIDDYPYFGTFKKIAAEFGLPLQHVDLFFVREKNQKLMEKMVLNADRSLNIFGQQQLALAKRLMAVAEPKIILVANAFAARIFKTHFGLGAALDDDGLYRVELAGRSVPVFLSSMLSGARALDTHSRERLLWHMKRCLSAR